MNLVRIYSREVGTGLWHRARETYQSAALTYCDRTIDASLFATHPRELELRPEFCEACKAPELVAFDALRAAAEE
jgi:hypothetical protein